MSSTFTWTPDFGASSNSTPAVKQVKFGDGYEQRQAGGINPLLPKWSLRFSVRDDTETAAIEAFLISVGAQTSFIWTPPKSSTAGKYVCRSWVKQIDTAVSNTITATFEQVAEP